MSTNTILAIVAVSGFLVYGLLLWRLWHGRKYLLIGGAIGSVIGLLVAGAIEGGDSGNLAAEVGGTALATFGGAYLAFMLSERSQKQWIGSQYRVAAIEAIEAMIDDPHGIGGNPWDWVHHGELFEPFHRMARRTRDQPLINLCQALDNARKNASEIAQRAHTNDELDKALQAVLVHRRALRIRVEERLAAELHP